MLERFPPGQAATSIIPNAMEGGGLKINVSKNVKAGKRINWAARPIQGALGATTMRLKSSSLSSRATPNIIRPMATLIIKRPWGLKFNRT